MSGRGEGAPASGVDWTHDAARRSWVRSANEPGCDFPVQNLPLGVFRRPGEGGTRIGSAIGEEVLDLSAAVEAGLLQSLAGEVRCALCAPLLDDLLRQGRPAGRALRHALAALLDEAAPAAERARAERSLVARGAVAMALPATIGDYTDFYSSVHHATNVGRLFRPDQPLLPNYKWVPIGYHGRASSLVVSGSAVTRPCGQTLPPGTSEPVFGSSRSLDYELELGLIVGAGNPPGEPVPIERAEDHLFAVCLVNDWSARDLQAWEYQPLGPFLAKSFATSVSPWWVTLDALEPFRDALEPRAAGDPAPLPHLRDRDPARAGFALTFEVFLTTARMREQGTPPHRVSGSDARSLYWSPAQLIAHHTSNGCNLRAGDLLASGTISGNNDDALGCLLEITQRGQRPLRLPNGEERRGLEDGDEVTLRGRCARDGFRTIGLGECTGRVAVAA